MPRSREPAEPNKRNPTGVRKAGAGKRWVLQGTVGNFTPEAVPSKRDTDRLTKQERAAGLARLDSDTEFDYREGRVKRREEREERRGRQEDARRGRPT